MSQNETNGDGRARNLPGLYRHPESGAEVITTEDAKLGSAMSDGVFQVGYRYVGPAPKEINTDVKAPEAEKQPTNKKEA